jgi:hypothetical protein
MAAKGFVLEEVPLADQHPDYQLDDVQLWWFRR